MILCHNKYIKYTLPNNWCAEENADCLLLYNPAGNGAITASFFSVLSTIESLDEQVSILAKKFIDRNGIHLHTPLFLLNKGDKTVLYGTGTTFDGWFLKLWVVAQSPQIVFATYQSKQKSKEVKVCDSIIDSIQFTLYN